MNEKKANLIQLSKKAKQLRDTKPEFSQLTINQIITEIFYKGANDGITTFKTLKEWNKEGKKVIKGSKSFPVWGRPRKAEKKEEREGETIEEKYEFFPMAYLFANTQVE